MATTPEHLLGQTKQTKDTLNPQCGIQSKPDTKTKTETATAPKKSSLASLSKDHLTRRAKTSGISVSGESSQRSYAYNPNCAFGSSPLSSTQSLSAGILSLSKGIPNSGFSQTIMVATKPRKQSVEFSNTATLHPSTTATSVSPSSSTTTIQAAPSANDNRLVIPVLFQGLEGINPVLSDTEKPFSIGELHLNENLQLNAHLNNPEYCNTLISLDKLLKSTTATSGIDAENLKNRLKHIQEQEKLAGTEAAKLKIETESSFTENYKNIDIKNLKPQSLIDYFELRKIRVELQLVCLKLNAKTPMATILGIPKLTDSDAKRAEKALDRSIKAGSVVLMQNFITGFNAVNKKQADLKNTKDGLRIGSPSYNRTTRRLENNSVKKRDLDIQDAYRSHDRNNKPEQEFHRLRETLIETYSDCCSGCGFW